MEGDGEGNLEIRPAVAGSRMRGKIRNAEIEKGEFEGFLNS